MMYKRYSLFFYIPMISIHKQQDNSCILGLLYFNLFKATDLSISPFIVYSIAFLLCFIYIGMFNQ